MTELALYAGIATILLLVMFVMRNSMLGFPSGMFWAIAGAKAYTLSQTPWGDTFYFMFFASFGMTIFTIFAAYAVNRSDLEGPDDLDKGGKFFDEKAESDLGYKQRPTRQQAVQKRTERRRNRRGGKHFLRNRD